MLWELRMGGLKEKIRNFVVFMLLLQVTPCSLQISDLLPKMPKDAYWAHSQTSQEHLHGGTERDGERT